MLSKPITVLILLLLYFSIPKFDLFFVPGSVTGIRIQDLICLILFLILFEYRFNTKIFLIFLLLVIHLFYSSITWANYTSIYGFLRLIEYFFVAKGIVLIVEKGYWNTFFNIIVAYIFIFSVLQYLTIIPNFDPGRGIIYSKQFSGPFGTPAELTYFIIPFLYLNYYINKFGIIKLLICSLVLLNGVKAGILGYTILVGQYIRLNKSTFFLLPFLALAIFITINEYLFIFLEFIKTIFTDGIVQNRVSEESLNLRVNKWGTSISQLYHNPLAIFFGFGVYSYTQAMDGGILKFLFEFGLIVFGYILYIIYKESKLFFLIVLAISLLFDAHMSSVVMPVLISTYLIINKRLEYIKS